ncbi:hypothetical protein C0J26_11975 [Pseudomonas baetica]|nr:hypothetical protein C0J26_11975 [Pseudomonas baetica]
MRCAVTSRPESFLTYCGAAIREQARSHRGFVHHTDPMWERACSRRTITRTHRIKIASANCRSP